jgi:hypothetical protein
MKTAQYDTPAQLAYYEAICVADETYLVDIAAARNNIEARIAARLNHTAALRAARTTYEATLAEGTESE